eukprot:gene17334-22879_t
MNCNAAIESLVKIAGWDGPVYLLTDKTKCFDQDSLIKDSGIKPSNLRIVETKEDFDSGGLDISHPSIGARKNRVKSFAMKTRLFEYITDPSIDIIAYADCDIIFGLQGCAKSFISAGPEWGLNENAIKFSHLYRDNDNRFIGMHCGSFVAHRKYSKLIMKIWKDEIEKFIDGDDNDAYMTAYYRIQKEINKNITNHSTNYTNNNATTVSNYSNSLIRNPLEPDELTCVGCNDEYERFVHPIDDPSTNVHCLNHISKARCKTYGRDNVQAYVNRFQLSSYENKYKYCMNPYLQPLSYGWFPLSYLSWGDSCVKLEKYF